MTSQGSPKRTSALRAGDLWSIPLSDGRFACVRVERFLPKGEPGATVHFVAALMDWVGDDAPTPETIAGAGVLEYGHVHIDVLATAGAHFAGHRAPAPAEIDVDFEVNSYWGPDYPAGRAEHLFVEGDPPDDLEVRWVESPLTDDMLAPFTSPERIVQFSEELTAKDLQRLSEWLRGQANVTLRVWGDSIRDLEFLRWFPWLRRFTVEHAYHSLTSLDGLRHLPEDAESIGIGQTKKPLDLDILGRFPALRELYLEGQTRHIDDVVASLTQLESLTLRSITLPDLSTLLPLTNLRALDLKLGGTKDLALLPHIGRLEYLELWMIRGLTDLAAIGSLPHLSYLFLQSLSGVTALPSLQECVSLRRVHLETMKRLLDLTPVSLAPNLQDLIVVDCPQFRVAHFEPFVGHRQLRAATIGTGSVKRNDEIEKLLGHPSAGHKLPWREVTG